MAAWANQYRSGRRCFKPFAIRSASRSPSERRSGLQRLGLGLGQVIGEHLERLLSGEQFLLGG
jgi:hypothetical protein